MQVKLPILVLIPVNAARAGPVDERVVPCAFERELLCAGCCRDVSRSEVEDDGVLAQYIEPEEDRDR